MNPKIKFMSKDKDFHLGTPKKSITYALETASKTALQKTAKATGDLVENNIADKITSAASQKFSSKSTESITPAQTDDVSIEILRLLYSSDYCNNYDYTGRELEYQKIINCTAAQLINHLNFFSLCQGIHLYTKNEKLS